MLKRFGSVSVLNGQIHQIVQKVKGHITYHTARATAFPQPGVPTVRVLKVAPEELPHMLGMTSVTIVGQPRSLASSDTALGWKARDAPGRAGFSGPPRR